MLTYNREWLVDFERSLHCEWLITNGVGGFGMSSILGINTRRYHGLLTASLKPPVSRFLLLSKYEEVLWIGEHSYALSANLYPGTTYPTGYQWLTEVRLLPFPTFSYEVDGAVLEKRVFLIQGENSVVVEWELVRRPSAECRISVRPLIAFRDYHTTTHENEALNRSCKIEGRSVIVKPYNDLPALNFSTTAADIEPVGQWYRRFQYPLEKERGLDYEEDLFCPFEASFDLTSIATSVASTQNRPAAYAAHFRHAEAGRSNTDFLSRAAEQFFANRPGKTILAGYPWFTDWGRDTMISLPGLTLATGRPEIAKSILMTFAAFVDGGMIPNRFPDSGEPPEYNTVDASLWYFEAVAKYVRAGNSFDDIRAAVYPALKNIIEGYRKGTRFEIFEDADGLIHSGPQLTWMDAVVNGVPVTPRAGKAVEIQALWYNARRLMEELTGEADESLEAFRDNFERQFWNPSTGCYDDVAGESSVRPNQLLALSLTHPIARPPHALGVLRVIQRDLLTPYGIRTLSPADPRYRGQCTGSPEQRDSAYHQGTVWPWLLGPYVFAARSFHFPVGDVMQPLRDYAAGPGCGQIPEIFDGDPPHAPRGCPAQAWSVAEVLRSS